MNVQLPQKGVTVNYVYWLAKPLTELQIELFRLSYLKCKEYGYFINIHCNKEFRELCERENIIPNCFYPLKDNPDIDFKTFWAYHKIKVYNSRPIGEWHLDIDAVFKEEPIYNPEVDLQIAYHDNPEEKLGVISAPDDYNVPVWAIGSLEGFNMSAVLFNNNTLKDIYCQHAFYFMKNNWVVDNGWKHMVYVEQAALKQMVNYYKYSYKYISDYSDYYHLGAAKNTLTSDEKEEQLKKIKNKIWQLLHPVMLESS